MHDSGTAIAEYRTVLAERGQAYRTETIAYPAALAALAGQYATTGDRANSDSAAAAFRAQWRDGTAANRLLATSLVNARGRTGG